MTLLPRGSIVYGRLWLAPGCVLKPSLLITLSIPYIYSPFLAPWLTRHSGYAQGAHSTSAGR